ncbi:hypothetical protein I7I53_05289 [Histoplasma capsulatum var. duboisii H88]|uniref:Uncharacterized protein n=1 Tax=Ajellomyces capsulatus (strain H88) TaxID=544711 RepID=A0A8A1LSM2_AJEC8|nr:hypothetical protein I7I53_05289 [Histoplasma capsulatum var. duboisii H88]
MIMTAKKWRGQDCFWAGMEQTDTQSIGINRVLSEDPGIRDYYLYLKARYALFTSSICRVIIAMGRRNVLDQPLYVLLRHWRPTRCSVQWAFR